jgi:hypothetical protein
MKIKWQWFAGGRIMFWIAIILLSILIISFITTYIIDPTTLLSMKVQSVNERSIREISEQYISDLGLEINRPIIYRFVRYTSDKGFKADPGDVILLGTFHEWNGTYYIDISVDLYKMHALKDTVEHETRHMIVEYLKDEKIIDLEKYTENIAREEDSYYINLFVSGVQLLKRYQDKK